MEASQVKAPGKEPGKDIERPTIDTSDSQLTQTKENVVEQVHRIRIKPSRGWVSLNLHELWEQRELLYFFTWRDIKVRYKQTALGALWAILQPFLTMVIFSIVFGQLAKVPSDGFPYPIFVYCALLPWQLFSQSVTGAGNSLVASQHLISKIYFPRLLLPMSAVLAGLVDFGVAFIVLLGMMLFYGVVPTPAILLLPLFILLAVASALAVGLWLSALSAQYRDVRHTIPFLIQFWMYATPVLYSSSLVPEAWRPLYGLNPMAGVVEGFRWTLLGKSEGVGLLVLVSAVVVMVILVGGMLYFRRMERIFADVV